MNDQQKTSIDLLTFALLGAYHSGQGHAAQDTRVGATFRGAIPAVEQATGISRAYADCDPQWRAIHAMFMSGYLDHLKTGEVYTDESGTVVRFKRRRAGETH